MNGLEEKENVIFFDTYKDNFTTKVTPETPKAIQRTDANGKIVHELRYGKMTGKIILAKIEQRTAKDGNTYDNLKLNLEYVNSETKEVTVFKLTLGRDSKAARGFFHTMVDIDYSKPVRLEIWGDPASISVYQDDEKLDWRWTKESPGKKPNWEPIDIGGGKVVYNRDAEFAYFQGIIDDHVTPKIIAALANENSNALLSEPPSKIEVAGEDTIVQGEPPEVDEFKNFF